MASLSRLPEGEDVNVRRADVADAALVAEVGTASFRAAYGPHSNAADVDSHIASSFSESSVRKRMVDGHCTYYLAEVDGKPAGMARVALAACPVPGGDDNALELQQLYVLSEMHGYGLGRRLIQRVIEHAEREAAKGVWLSAWEFADWATGFYSSVGFEAIGKVEFKLGSTAFTDLLMWRALR